MTEATAVAFMSQEHVDRMNALLAESQEVRAACAQLTAARAIGYRLTDGPAGQTIHWRMSFQDTVQFDLVEGPMDVVFVGDWAQMIRASIAARSGDPIDPLLTVEGDSGVLDEIGAAMEVARSVATVDVRFPEL